MKREVFFYNCSPIVLSQSGCFISEKRLRTIIGMCLFKVRASLREPIDIILIVIIFFSAKRLYQYAC